MTNLIVTSINQLPKNKGSYKSIILIGDKFDKNINISYQPHLISNHWDDEYKRHKDYLYLEKFYRTLLIDLASSLNQAHNLNFDTRYWEIIVGSWLVVFISAFFDKWEMMRLSLSKAESAAIFVPDELIANFQFIDTNQFTTLVASNDSINHKIFYLAARHLDSKIIKIANSSKENKSISINSNKSFVKLFFNYVYSYINIYLLKKSKFIFFTSYFPNAAKRKIKYFYSENCVFDKVIFDTSTFPSSKQFDKREIIHNTILSNIKNINNFEYFCYKEISKFLPESFVENFKNIRNRYFNAFPKCKLIFTANSHWWDDGFKIWASERVASGAKLIIADHGGAIPPLDYVFRFEENISDVYATPCPPCHPKHIQLPATVFTGPKVDIAKLGKKLTIVSYPADKWVMRAASQPLGHRALHMIPLLNIMVKSIDTHIFNKCLLKLPVNSSRWNYFENQYKNMFPYNQISRAPFRKVIKTSKIILCTYPQSTFSEAMMSGIPTLLLIEPKFHYPILNANSLFEEMIANKICFYDPVQAARHINLIWNNPLNWWNSPAVRNTRDLFKDITCNNKDDPMQDWLNFFDSQLN